VIDRGRNPRLAHKPLPEHVVVRKLGREELEGDQVSQAGILRPEYHAHTAPAEQAIDAVPSVLRAYL